MTRVIWDQTKVDTLKTLWAKGLSASQVAREMGIKSRSAIIGKVHRLCLPYRTTITRFYGTGRPARERDAAIRLKLSQRSAPRRVTFASGPLPPEPPRPAKLFKLADMEDHQCRYVFGDPRGSHAWGYCGCSTAPGSSYCIGHHAKVYAGVPVRSKSADIPEWRGKHRLDKHGSKYAGKAVAL